MTELTVVEEQGSEIALPPDFDDRVAGEENLRQGDTGMPPRLRISSQNRPIEGTEPGDIVNTLTGAVSRTIEFIPMVFLPTTRVMWPATFDANNTPVCVSDDGTNPLDDQNRATNPQEGPCSMCSYSQFGGDGTPPVCKAQRNFLVLTLPDYEPAIITLSSTGIAVAKQLTALARMTGIRKAIVMATRQVSSDKGTWWAPQFVVGSKLANDEVLMAAEFRNGLKNLIITADIVQENGASEPAGNVVNGTAAPVMYDPDEEMPF